MDMSWPMAWYELDAYAHDAGDKVQVQITECEPDFGGPRGAGIVINPDAGL